MSSHDIIIAAEGPARVGFAALACGCGVVATPNPGSIVQDGRHGALMAPGSVKGSRPTLRGASADRARLAAIRRRHAEARRDRWQQRHDDAALTGVYDHLRAAPCGLPAQRAA